MFEGQTGVTRLRGNGLDFRRSLSPHGRSAGSFPEQRLVIEPTVSSVGRGTVEGTTGVRTKTCVKDSSNLEDSFPF